MYGWSPPVTAGAPGRSDGIKTFSPAVVAALSLGLLLSHPSTASADVATDMLYAHNSLRYAIGVPTITADPRVTVAAQRHADYSSANGVGGHYETAGLPYYSGYAPRDRVVAAGWSTAWVSEVATGGSRTATDAVRQLWDAPYHRLGLMHPNAVSTGWGHSDLNSRSSTVGDLVYDFGIRPVEFVRSPAHLQTGIPTSWSGRESPSPLPTGVSGPVGYPIMVVYAGAPAVDMRGAEIVAPGGARLPIYYVPQQFERDYQVIIPQQPLAAGTTFHVRFDITVAGRWLTNEWDFTTAGTSTTSSPPAPSHAAGFHSSFLSQSAWPTLAVGETGSVTLRFTNTGSATWVKGAAGQEARLGVPGDDTSLAPLGVGWPLSSRPAVQTEATIAPGGVGTFTFQVRSNALGYYLIRLRPVIDGVTWMEDQGVYVVVAVR